MLLGNELAWLGITGEFADEVSSFPERDEYPEKPATGCAKFAVGFVLAVVIIPIGGCVVSVELAVR